MPEINSYYRDRERAARGRSTNNTRRDEPRQSADGLAVTMTAQMIVVILLLAAVWLLRSVNQESYYEFRENYAVLTGAESEVEIGSSALEDISRGLSDIFERFLGISESPSALDDGHVYIFDDENHLPPAEQNGVGTNPLVGTINGNIPHTLPEDIWLSPVFFTAQMRPPLTGRVTSPFGWRIHPITQNTEFHSGIDIAAPEGTPILAALPGQVCRVGWSRIYGNYIVLTHAADFETFYAHCKEIVALEGTSVSQGEKIALVGSTGVATGPHLHFGVIVVGKYTNPYWALADFMIVKRDA